VIADDLVAVFSSTCNTFIGTARHEAAVCLSD